MGGYLVKVYSRSTKMGGYLGKEGTAEVQRWVGI